MNKLLSKLTNPTAIFLGITFFGSGMAKLYFEHKYFGWIGPVWLEDKLAPHGLGLYARFIGYSQVTIGYLLLTLRFKTLGAIMATPLIINILMVTISLSWQGTPLVVSVLLMMNLLILYTDRGSLMGIVGYQQMEITTNPPTLSQNLIWLSGLILNLISINLSQINLIAAWSTSLVGLVLSYSSLWIKAKNLR